MAESNLLGLISIDESKRKTNNVCIKVVGVGGGGVNMVNYMARQGVRGIDLLAINTDAQSLQVSILDDRSKITLGDGLGAGGKPEVAREAAEKHFNQIQDAMRGANLVFIAAGMGGGTGTGAAAVVAHAAKETGALTIGVCTEPFSFELGRPKIARDGIEALKAECDSVVIIPNDKLLSLVEKKTGMKAALAIVDDVLAKAVRGISAISLPNGMEGINTDFNDLHTLMTSHRGQAIIGMGYSAKENAAYEALKEAIESPLLENLNINGATYGIVNFQIGPDYPIMGVNHAMQHIHGAMDPDAKLKFGVAFDENMTSEEARVTIIASIAPVESANNITREQPARSRAAVGGGNLGGSFTNQRGFEFLGNIAGSDLESPSINRRGGARKVVGGEDYEEFSKPAHLRRQID
ncbi:MAG: cell division protein FtsZ [Helicobacteraceae bacterium]|jgi:cell division protein FtsZ|nr:cell division protein FtsZ [Helicobacteraceae bacterium]